MLNSLQYCCHNTGTDRHNFKILGFKLLNNFKLFNKLVRSRAATMGDY